MTYLIPTVSPIKSYFLGGVFYGCFLWFTLVGLIDLLRHAGGAFPNWTGWIAPIVLLALCVATFRSVPLATPVDPATAAELNAVSDHTADDVINDMRSRSAKSAIVYFQTPDPVTSYYIVYRARLVGMHVGTAEGFYLQTLDDDKQAMRMADYAFLSEAATLLNFPGDRLNADLLAWIKTDANVSLLSDFVDAHGRHNYLYRRNLQSSVRACEGGAECDGRE